MEAGKGSAIILGDEIRVNFDQFGTFYQVFSATNTTGSESPDIAQAYTKGSFSLFNPTKADPNKATPLNSASLNPPGKQWGFVTGGANGYTIDYVANTTVPVMTNNQKVQMVHSRAPGALAISSWSAETFINFGISRSPLAASVAPVVNHDVSWDLPPSVILDKAPAGKTPEFKHIRQIYPKLPSPRWYRRAGVQKVASDYGDRYFFILTDLLSRFYVYPADLPESSEYIEWQGAQAMLPLDLCPSFDLEFQKAEAPSVSGMVHKPNFTFSTLPLGSWAKAYVVGDTPPESLGGLEAMDAALGRGAEQGFDYKKALCPTEYLWTFNYNATRAIAVAYELGDQFEAKFSDTPVKYFNTEAFPLGAIGEAQKNSKEGLLVAGAPSYREKDYPFKESKPYYPVLVEAAINIEVTGPDPFDFTADVSLISEVSSKTSGVFYIEAGYSHPEFDPKDKKGERVIGGNKRTYTHLQLFGDLDLMAHAKHDPLDFTKAKASDEDLAGLPPVLKALSDALAAETFRLEDYQAVLALVPGYQEIRTAARSAFDFVDLNTTNSNRMGYSSGYVRGVTDIPGMDSQTTGTDGLMYVHPMPPLGEYATKFGVFPTSVDHLPREVVGAPDITIPFSFSEYFSGGYGPSGPYMRRSLPLDTLHACLGVIDYPVMTHSFIVDVGAQLSTSHSEIPVVDQYRTIIHKHLGITSIGPIRGGSSVLYNWLVGPSYYFGDPPATFCLGEVIPGFSTQAVLQKRAPPESGYIKHPAWWGYADTNGIFWGLGVLFDFNDLKDLCTAGFITVGYRYFFSKKTAQWVGDPDTGIGVYPALLEEIKEAAPAILHSLPMDILAAAFYLDIIENNPSIPDYYQNLYIWAIYKSLTFGLDFLNTGTLDILNPTPTSAKASAVASWKGKTTPLVVFDGLVYCNQSFYNGFQIIPWGVYDQWGIVPTVSSKNRDSLPRGVVKTANRAQFLEGNGQVVCDVRLPSPVCVGPKLTKVDAYLVTVEDGEDVSGVRVLSSPEMAVTASGMLAGNLPKCPIEALGSVPTLPRPVLSSDVEGWLVPLGFGAPSYASLQDYSGPNTPKNVMVYSARLYQPTGEYTTLDSYTQQVTAFSLAYGQDSGSFVATLAASDIPSLSTLWHVVRNNPNYADFAIGGHFYGVSEEPVITGDIPSLQGIPGTTGERGGSLVEFSGKKEKLVHLYNGVASAITTSSAYMLQSLYGVNKKFTSDTAEKSQLGLSDFYKKLDKFSFKLASSRHVFRSFIASAPKGSIAAYLTPPVDFIRNFQDEKLNIAGNYKGDLTIDFVRAANYKYTPTGSEPEFFNTTHRDIYTTAFASAGPAETYQTFATDSGVAALGGFATAGVFYSVKLPKLYRHLAPNLES